MKLPDRIAFAMTDLAMPDAPLWKVSRPIRQALPGLPPASGPAVAGYQKRDNDDQRPPSSRSARLAELPQHAPPPLPPVYYSTGASLARRPHVFPTIPLSTAATITLDPVAPADSRPFVTESRSSLSNIQPLSPIGARIDPASEMESDPPDLDDSPNDSLLAVMAVRIAQLEATIDAMQIAHNTDESPLPTTATRRPWPSALVPNIQLLQAQVATLNSFAAAAPASAVVAVSPTDRSARLVNKAVQVQLVLFKDGMCLDDYPPMTFGDPAGMQVLCDLEDGYFPELLKERYPSGVPIHLVDKSKHSLHATQQPADAPSANCASPIQRTASRHDAATFHSPPTRTALDHRPTSSHTSKPTHPTTLRHHSCPILNLSSSPNSSSTTAFPLTIKVVARGGPLAILHCDARDTPRALADYLLKHDLLPASASIGRSFRPGRPSARAKPGFWMHKGSEGSGALDEDEAFVDVLGAGAGGSVVLYWD